MSKSIVYKIDGKIEEFDNKGNKQVSYIDDYIENIYSIKDIENPEIESDLSTIDNNSLTQATNYSYKIPAGYTFLKSEYSSAWKATGSLYKKATVSHGKEYKFEFSKGTQVSTVISILTTIGNFNVVATLATLGITVIGATIDMFATGKYKVRYTKDDIVIVCKNELGLRTNQTKVDAYVYSTTTGKLSIERIRISGDTRSHSDMIHAGIYNVMLFNN